MNDSEKTAEIEVTPEMVEAGLFELGNFNSEMDSGTEFVTRLFLAMCSNCVRHIHQVGPEAPL